jgi:integrase
MPRPTTGPKLRPNPKRGGLWYIFWTDERGRGRERSTGTRDHREAAAIFAEWLGIRARPLDWSGPGRTSETRIADVLKLYADEHVASDAVASKATALHSIDTLALWWGERTCDYVRKETCRAYVRDRVAAGWRDSTAARELTVLRAALHYAHGAGKLLDPPAVELPSRPPGRDRWLTRSEAAQLLWEARRDPQARDHLTHFILLGLATGARSGALFELQWSQVDFIGNLINFNPPGRKQTNKARPKIPIPRRLRWFLLRAHARATSTYVLAYNGKQIKSVKKSFRNARIRAGLGDDVIPYTLRHTCGTWMALAGVDLWTIGGWLGHSHTKTTELYAHHHPGYQEEARKVMD